jgi:alpha-tubulin suppressor-like RCC1 family protein/plastocyanin
MKIRSTLTLIVLSIAATLSACDEETVTGPGFVCDVTNPVRDLFLSPSGATVLVHSPALPGDTVQLVATATSRAGTVRTDVPISFSSSDRSIATVDTLGVVHAVAPGTATIKASSCGETRTATVTVIANVASVSLAPATDTIIAGDTATFTARASGPDNSRVPNVSFTFSAASGSVTVTQTSDSTAKVTSNTPGAYPIQARGEGVTGTGTMVVLARVFLAATGANTTIDVGDATGCGIITLGQGFCWGANDHGQLGAQSDTTCFKGVDPGAIVNDSLVTTAIPCSLVPLRVSQTIDFMTISAGDSTTCGISVAGRAYCWGYGLHGENGNGLTSDQASPKLVTGSLTFTSISVGGSHACAIATGGVAYCWGDDTFGQLGDSRPVSSTTPIPVVFDGAPAVFASISAGYQHTCGLQPDGTARCWGRNNFGQLGTGNTSTADVPLLVATSAKFTSISAGGDHTCGITTGGAALCWGSNVSGQLGIGSSGDFSTTPVSVTGGLTFSRISASTGTQFKTIGHGHTCGLTTTGLVFCWGDDTDLQVGRGTYSGGNGIVTSPAQVSQGERGAGVTFTSVSAGSRHSCAVGSDGNAYCWGSNVLGALGNTLQAAFRGQPQKVATPR